LIGGLIGAKFVLSGLSRLMYSLAMHKKLEARAQEQRIFACAVAEPRKVSTDVRPIRTPE
jgi:hypothetical protein